MSDGRDGQPSRYGFERGVGPWAEAAAPGWTHTDVLVWLIDTEIGRDEIHADPLYGTLEVRTQGRDVFVTAPSDVYAATSFQTVLSLPLLLDELVPRLAAAVDGTRRRQRRHERSREPRAGSTRRSG